MSPGLFVTLEGGEGTGKSTQIQRLSQQLTQAGYTVVTTREPGGVDEAEALRDLLVRDNGLRWTPMAECLMLFAGRTMHVDNLIKPSLSQGAIVISDRFTDSTRAYQGYGLGLSRSTIEKARELAIGDFEPDLTFVLDLPVEEGLKRSTKQLADTGDQREAGEGRYESREVDLHERLREGYLKIAREAPERCQVIDANMDIDSVTHSLYTEIVKRYQQQ
jgi:dTMP kinase